ncbi:MAG: metallophosphoesterase [Alphaproteobacteria bacterium]|nr:metallophosphoesterase [Alphaproteobacteria bacterium]
MSQDLEHDPEPGPPRRPRQVEELVEDKVYGFARPRPYHADVTIPGWNGRKRIAHLTDMHFGNVTPLALQRGAAALVNASHPDLTVLTGDFVARGLGHLDRLTETMAAIEGRKLAVMGNHDWWSGAADVRRALDAAGVEVVDNQWTLDGDGEDALPVLCIDDWTTGHHDVEQARKGLRGRPALALSHNPEAAPELWAAGASVVLSGHTHGGQFYVRRWTQALYKTLLQVEFLNGWYSRDGGQVYVNPGVGSSIVPFRYGRPAQRAVAILDLQGGEERLPEGRY